MDRPVNNIIKCTKIMNAIFQIKANWTHFLCIFVSFPEQLSKEIQSKSTSPTRSFTYIPWWGHTVDGLQALTPRQRTSNNKDSLVAFLYIPWANHYFYFLGFFALVSHRFRKKRRVKTLMAQCGTKHIVCELRKRQVTSAWNPKSVHLVQQHPKYTEAVW